LSGPARDQIIPPSRRCSPAEKPSSHIITAKNTEVLSETTSDTGDIFKVTDPEPVVIPQPKSPKSAELQDASIEEDTITQPSATHVNSADVSMQDTAALDGLRESRRDGVVSETQLIHSESHKGYAISSEERLPMQTQQSGSCQGHDGEQDPVPKRHSVEDHQSIEDDHPIEESQPVKAKQSIASGLPDEIFHNMPSTNVDQNTQPPPTPANTSLPTSKDAQQPLRGVNRSGSSRVTKMKRKPPQASSSARTPNSSSYTAAQLYQLAEYMKEQEQLQEKQDWAKNLATKQEALDKANRHKSKLQAECAQLKASLEKYYRATGHLQTIVKVFNGLGQDLQRLQSSGAKHDEEIRNLRFQLHANREAVTSIPEQIARLTDLKANIFRLTKEQQLTITNLEIEKSDLAKRLCEVSESLAREESRQDAFDEGLQSFQSAQNSTADMLIGCISNINDRLSEFATFAQQSTSSSQASLELLELMKKETAVISNQICSSGTDMEVMKTSVENLSLG
jgi:predicted  nucleic acid-binding Zn-ribbon protein